MAGAVVTAVEALTIEVMTVHQKAVEAMVAPALMVDKPEAPVVAGKPAQMVLGVL